MLTENDLKEIEIKASLPAFKDYSGSVFLLIAEIRRLHQCLNRDIKQPQHEE